MQVRPLIVTQALNSAIARGDNAFGMGLTQMGYAKQFANLGAFTLTVTPAVPKPSTYALLLGSLALLGVMRKRRR